MLSRRLMISLTALVAALAGLTAALFPRLPERVAMHWNIHGEVDRYGSRWELALLLPCIVAGLALLLIALPALGPKAFNVERFRRTYERLSEVLIGAFGAIQGVLLLNAAGVPIRVDRALLVVIGLMLAFVGNMLGKVRRNFWIGIRTPWTLASDAVWERTHRVGAWVFVGWGLAIAASGFLFPGLVAGAVMLAGALGMVAWAFGYSFYLSRRLG